MDERWPAMIFDKSDVVDSPAAHHVRLQSSTAKVNRARLGRLRRGGRAARGWGRCSCPGSRRPPTRRSCRGAPTGYPTSVPVPHPPLPTHPTPQCLHPAMRAHVIKCTLPQQLSECRYQNAEASKDNHQALREQCRKTICDVRAVHSPEYVGGHLLELLCAAHDCNADGVGPASPPRQARGHPCR